jgi:hypothetical protein
MSANPSTFAAAIDELTKCRFCQSNIVDALTLPCQHSFCKTCLNSNTAAGKLTCLVCNRVHNVPNGNVEKAFRDSTLTQFLMKVKENKYDELARSMSNEELEKETMGQCAECSPAAATAQQHSKKKSVVAPSTAGNNQVALLEVRVAECLHCKKKLCESCRSKHYNQQKIDTLKLLESNQESSGSIVVTAGTKSRNF